MSTKEIEGQVKVGPWTILHELGEGGMARVSFAKRTNIEGDDGNQQVVVVKTPKDEFLVDARRRKLFFDEIGVASKMTHPNVVKAIDWGVDDGLPYIAMEFVAGGNLSALITAASARKDEFVCTVELAAYVVQQVAYGLQYAHTFKIGNVSERIIHRDVAAKNVLVSGAGAVLLADFGVASALSIESSANVLKGTAAYMAPEHAVGKATQASDCFGLGTILWTLLAGKRFRHDIESNDMLRAAVQGHISPMERPLPDDIRRVLEGLLHPEQGERMGLADALTILERYPSQRSILAKFVCDVFGSDATRSGHTRVELEVPKALLASKEFARTRKRTGSASSEQVKAEHSTAEVLSPAALDAPPAAGTPVEATLDFGTDFNPVQPRDDDAPSAPSYKRRRSSDQSAAGAREPASALPPPQTPAGSEAQLAPPQFASRRAPRKGLKVLLAGLGVGAALAGATTLGYILKNKDPQESSAAKLSPATPGKDPQSPDAARAAEPPLQSPTPAPRPLEIGPEPAPPPPLVAAAPEPTAEPGPPGPAADVPPPAEPEQEPEPKPATKSEPKPRPKPKVSKVDVTLKLGFADAAKAKLGGRTINLDKSNPEKTIRLPFGKRTLQWQRPDGSWKRQAWKLEDGCRHIAIFDATKPRISTKCPGPK